MIGLPAAIALTGGLNVGTSLLNFYQQQQQFDYSKKLQNKLFSREDNSVQRRVADLNAAGLSPVLAAGSGAEAGPVVSTKAPQLDDLGILSNAMNAMQIENINTQIDQRNADISKTNAETAYINQQAKNARSAGYGIDLENIQKKREAEITEGTGTTKNAGTFFQTVRDASAFWDNIKKQWNRTSGQQPKKVPPATWTSPRG